MSEPWDDDPAPQRHRRGHRARRSARLSKLALDAAEEQLGSVLERRRRRDALTPEQRTLHEARRAANRTIGFLAHAIPYATVCFGLLIAAGLRPALIVAAFWGIAVAIHGFFALVVPGLRERLVETEVERRVSSDVSQQRRSLEDEHARRLEELSASIAHEIRNPITAARSLVQQMGEDAHSPDNVEYAKVALDELQRVERSVSHLLRFAREEDLELAELELAPVVEAALETLRERLRASDARVEVDVPAGSRLRADAEKLRRVLLNLVTNALDACEASGVPPRVRIEAGENLAGSHVWLRVRDEGPGIEPERLARIFDPFYTSKSGGTGLGLAITKKLVVAHGGSIEAHSTPGRGAEFLISLPRCGPEARA
jgi:signal transduction histidine kinase